MSVLIKGMDMPKCCEVCEFNSHAELCFFLGDVDESIINGSIDLRCPLIEIIECKDCKHYNPMTKGCKRNPSVEGWEKNDFCSYGEVEK